MKKQYSGGGKTFDLTPLDRALKAQNPAKFYIFHGEERYLEESYIKRLQSMFEGDGLAEFNIRRFDGSTVTTAEIADAIDALPCFAERALVRVDDFDLFKAENCDALLPTLSNLPDYICVLFVFHTLSYTPDSRRKSVKELLAHAEVIRFDRQTGAPVVKWINKHAAIYGKTISSADAQYLMEITDGTLATLNTELEKLCTSCAEDVITRKFIDDCIPSTAKTKSYLMTAALAEGRTKDAARMLSDLFAMQEVPHVILQQISKSFNELLYAKQCIVDGKSLSYYLSNSDYSEYSAKIIYNAAKKLSLEECVNCVKLTVETAMRLNSGDKGDAITELIGSIAGKKQSTIL